MASSTEEFWSLNEVSLHQFGWAVTTVGGARYDVPPRRGSNMSVAYRPGQLHRRKLPDQRTITLLMFMVGWNPALGPVAGQNPTVADQRVQWNDNWDFLRRLVYENYLLDNRVTLTRRWRLTSPNFPTSRSGDSVKAGDPGTVSPNQDRIVTASAYAEMTGSMTPTMTGRTRAEFQMDFTLADPYFYGSQVTATLNPGDTAYLWNDGHDVAAHAGVSIDLVGPLTNPILRNFATDPYHYLGYSGTIPAGQTVTLNPGRYTAVQHGSSASPTTGTNRIASVNNSGAQAWLNVLPGTNKLTFSATGSGHVTVKFQPPYI